MFTELAALQCVTGVERLLAGAQLDGVIQSLPVLARSAVHQH